MSTARVTVHFNAVTERFSPHDTEFSITSAKELRDTTLSAACSLHTASGSTSSSTSSLRRRRLMEIAEDEEEDLRAKRQSTVHEERPSTAKTISASGAPTTTDLPELPLGPTPSITYLSSSEDDSFPPPRVPLSPTKSVGEERKSFQSTRPELYSSASYGSSGRPKVKLGPRPSLDVGGRPHTSGAASYYRPVSTLPAGMKLFGKGGSKKEKDRPHSLYPTTETPSMTISPPSMPDSALMPTQDVLIRPHTSGGRPPSSQSIKPLISPSAPTFPKTPVITAEKARLMKAMELRKKQQAAKLLSNAAIPSAGLEPVEATSGGSQDATETLSVADEDTKIDDSGVAFDAGLTAKTDDSDATRSDSCPMSPVGPSEHAESTKASSISDSTDETVQEPGSDTTNEIFDKGPVPEQNVAGPETSQEIRETGLISPETKRESLQKLFPTVYNPLQHAEESLEQPPTLLEIPAVIQEEQFPPDVPEEIAVSEPASKLSEDASESALVLTHEEGKIEPATREAFEQKSTPLAGPTDDPKVGSAPETSVPKGSQSPLLTPTEEPNSTSSTELQAGQTSPAKTWKVPRSKFSVQDLRAETEPPAVTTEPMPRLGTATIPPPEKSPVESTFSTDSRRSVPEGQPGPVAILSKRKKRRGLVEPIRTDLDPTSRSGGNSEANFSSDDDLMDELQSAVFQEAKPISVSKSPISPVFPSPKRQTTLDPSRFSRAISNPLRKESSDSKMLELPSSAKAPGPARSVSAGAAYLNRISQQQAKPLPKKVNLGSGISQRIKALEKFSSLTPGATPIGTTAPNAGASTAFFSVRKASVRSQSPSVAERTNSFTRHTPSPSSSPETSKRRERSGSVKSRLEVFNSNPMPTSQPGRSRPETVSVTARIIRDPAQPFPALPHTGKDPADFAPLDLKQSPLVIDHQKAIPEPQKETIRERRLSNSSKTTLKERRSSITVIKDLISDGRASFSDRRRSMNLEPSASTPSILSPSRPPSVHQSPSRRPSSVSSRRNSRDLAAGFSPPPTAGSLSSTSDDRSEKKTTRASRMLRRMSSSLTAGRKTIAHAMSPTVREESEPVPSLDFQSPTSSHPSNAPVTPTSMSVGDVNVQFPDSLLWKRRSMLLDSAGYLILSPALTTGKQGSTAGATRRFHMSEFRTPAVPDMEMEELPNSIVLDFIEGGGLQVACEDRAGQGRVLKSMSSTTTFFISILTIT